MNNLAESGKDWTFAANANALAKDVPMQAPIMRHWIIINWKTFMYIHVIIESEVIQMRRYFQNIEMHPI